MTQKKSKSQFTSKWKFTPTSEENNGKSETVQGEAYTVQELLNRHVQGLMPPVGLTPLYDHDEPTHDDYVGMRKPDFDLTDIDEIKAKVKDANQKITKAKNLKKAKQEAEQNDRLSVAKNEALRGSAADGKEAEF